MKVAIVQEPPVLLDRAATRSRVVGHIEAAARSGVSLMVFPETYVPGYPEWLWRLRPWQDAALANTLHARLLENAVRLAGPDLDEVRAAARAAGMTVLLGVHERGDFSGTTLYNTLVTIGPDGALICWENYMPLARFALYADGVEIYVASTWDYGDAWRASMQHIAKEGRCWVLSAGTCFQAADVP